MNTFIYIYICIQNISNEASKLDETDRLDSLFGVCVLDPTGAFQIIRISQ